MSIDDDPKPRPDDLEEAFEDALSPPEQGAPANQAEDAGEDLFEFEDSPAEAEASEDAPAPRAIPIELAELAEALAEIPETAPNPSAPVTDTEPSPAKVVIPKVVRPVRDAGVEAAPDEYQIPMQAAAGMRIGPFDLTRVTLLAVALLTLVNAGVVTFSWMANNNLQDSVEKIGNQVLRTARDIQNETIQQAQAMESLVGPVAASDPASYRTFDRVAEDFEDGEFSSARKRLYALLSVTDRLGDDVREDTEARARFLIADSYRRHAESLDSDSMEAAQ